MTARNTWPRWYCTVNAVSVRSTRKWHSMDRNRSDALRRSALLRNASLRFLSMECHLRVERTDTAFTVQYQRGQVFRAVMAHGDGNYFADDGTLDRLEGDGLVALRYASPTGEIVPEANRNGSARNIAGILSP